MTCYHSHYSNLIRCTAHRTKLDNDESSTRRCKEHTEALVQEFELGVLWDEYGIVGDVVVRTYSNLCSRFFSSFLLLLSIAMPAFQCALGLLAFSLRSGCVRDAACRINTKLLTSCSWRRLGLIRDPVHLIFPVH